MKWWPPGSTPATRAAICCWCSRSNLDGSNRGDAVVALDAVGAGVGDKVLLTTDGYAAMSSVGRTQSPIDMAVIGLIDRVDLDGMA